MTALRDENEEMEQWKRKGLPSSVWLSWMDYAEFSCFVDLVIVDRIVD